MIDVRSSLPPGAYMSPVEAYPDLLVIPTSDKKGYTCLGRGVAAATAAAIARALADDPDVPALVAIAQKPDADPLDAFGAYYTILERARAAYPIARKTRCPALLSAKIGGLEGERITIIWRNGVCRPPWHGIVGRTTGWLPVNLMLSRVNSISSPRTVSVLDDPDIASVTRRGRVRDAASTKETAP